MKVKITITADTEDKIFSRALNTLWVTECFDHNASNDNVIVEWHNEKGVRHLFQGREAVNRLIEFSNKIE